MQTFSRNIKKKNIDDYRSWENKAYVITISQKKKKGLRLTLHLFGFSNKCLFVTVYIVIRILYNIYIYINHRVVLFDACRVGSARVYIILNTSSSCATRVVHLAAIAERISPTPHWGDGFKYRFPSGFFLWSSKCTTI